MELLLNSVANGTGFSKWYFYVGIAAAVLIAIFTVPQLITVLRTKDTSGISLPMYIILCTGDFLFVLNGIGILIDKDVATGLPIFLANLIAGTVATTILAIKIRNMIWARRRGISERQLAENFKQICAEEKEAKMLEKSEKDL